ncbi:MAG: polysaccharide deacetylase family protein, partial [Proteobacteria bacterium]|nr:polysaccharide deacetylase family protein [Pseudomonadota bacterium]
VSLMQELTHSKAMLEDMLGNPVGSFAYPYGDWDARCVQAAQQAGYAAACTTEAGWALRDQTPYQLRRLTIFNTDTPGRFTRKLSFGSHDVRWRDLSRYALRRLRGI